MAIITAYSPKRRSPIAPGPITPAAPITSKELNRLEPSRFPSTSALARRRAAAKVVANSGRLVPRAKMVAPTNPPVKPRACAVRSPPSTSSQEPATIPPSDQIARNNSPPSRRSASSSPRPSAADGVSPARKSRPDHKNSKIMAAAIPASNSHPSVRPKKSSHTAQVKTAIANSVANPSRRISRAWLATGASTALIPSTSDRLAALEPTTFPTDSANSPRKAATALTVNSGAEVPKPTTSAPISTGEARQMRARRVAATTK